MEGFIPGRRRRARVERVYEPGPSGTVRPLEHRVYIPNERGEEDIVPISNEEIAALGLEENSDYSNSARSGSEKVLEAAYRKNEGIPVIQAAEQVNAAATPENPVDDTVQSHNLPPHDQPQTTPSVVAKPSASHVAAVEKKVVKHRRFVRPWMMLLAAPFAAAWGMAWLQYQTVKGMWWASGKIYGEKEKKSGGGHEKKQEKKNDHGGGHGHH